MNITAAPAVGDSMVESIYEEPDYLDRFVATVRANAFGSVDDVATAWFAGQPGWLRLLRTNTLSKTVVDDAIAQGYQVGRSVGSWEVIDRNDEEIVFGDDMGFMQYRFAFRLPGAGETVEAGTAVKFVWRRTGRFYFALVQPFHRLFVRFLLKRSASARHELPLTGARSGK